MHKVLITGINGFVGKHLAVELKKRGCSVLGVGREPAIHPEIENLIDKYFSCDLTNETDVNRLELADIEAVISLAGFASVGGSFGQAELYNRVNVGVLSVIGTRLTKLGTHTRVIAVSTGAVYAPDQPLPLAESSALVTTGSPYALSKISMEQEATRLRELGLNCIVVRPFNHIGPGQGSGFIVPDLYQKMLAAEKSGSPVKAGNLTTRRDYTDVRDVVCAYALLALAEPVTLTSDVYNICSGISKSGQEIFDELKKYTNGPVSVVVDASLTRPNDPEELIGSYQLLKADTGWQPKIPFEQTIADFAAS